MTNSNHKAILLLLTLFIVTHKSKAGTCDCPYTRINGKLLYSLNNALLPLQIESNVSQIFRPAFRAAVYDVSPNVVTGCGTALALGNGSSYITESNAGTSDGASSLKEKYDAAHISNPAFTVEYGGLDWSEFDVTINIAVFL